VPMPPQVRSNLQKFPPVAQYTLAVEALHNDSARGTIINAKCTQGDQLTGALFSSYCTAETACRTK